MVPATPKASAAAGGSWSCSIYGAGNTRVQLARRVLTGGWGWNTTHFDATNGSADALLRTDGVMDQYKVRWGVSYYDGLGTRLVVDPTANNLAAREPDPELLCSVLPHRVVLRELPKERAVLHLGYPRPTVVRLRLAQGPRPPVLGAAVHP